MSWEEAASSALRRAVGDGARFRPQQLEAIQVIVEGQGKALVVQRTGWGKSIVYFVATRLLRDRGAGPTLLVSPLLALMRDQIRAADRLGLVARSIDSSNRSAWADVEDSLNVDEVDVLLVSPERLNNPDFRERLLVPLASTSGLLVVDEAHCISDWGHDFRPDYRRLARVVSMLPQDCPVLCTTATANDRVIRDISDQLGSDLAVVRGPLDRTSLRLSVVRLDTPVERMAWLADWIPDTIGCGLVYCLTVADANRVASWLTSRGIAAAAYSGETSPDERLEIESGFSANELKVVVATSALGMGYDKPDLSFVVHYQCPDSPVAYYQQVGRAGRALAAAEAVLLVGREDQDIWEYFLESGLPKRELAELAVHFLTDRAEWVTEWELEEVVNMRQSRLQGLLKVLEVEGAVERQGRQWRRTLRPWTFDADRFDLVRQQRLAEQQSMRDYVELETCRMQFLLQQLDDSSAISCGRCDNCTDAPLASEVHVERAAEAMSFLRHQHLSLQPRKRWPGGTHTGAIPRELRVEPGLALGQLGDGAWSRVILDSKRSGRHFPTDLVAAAAETITQHHFDPPPEVIAYVPASAPDRDFVPDLAMRLGDRLGLPVVHAVGRTRATGRQKLQENSQQQLANVWGAYTVEDGSVPSSILLVDDVADSRWTMTVVGAALRAAGAEHVWPFVLAKSRG